MNPISRNLVTIYRTERLIARRRLAVVQRQTVLMVLAGIAVTAGLVLLNLSVFLALQTWMSAASSAAVLSAANLLLGGLLVLFVRRTNVDEELAPAIEVRDMAIADIEAELDDMATEAREVVKAVKSIGSNPLGSLVTLLVPILNVLLKDRKDS